jgi:hypothetical protein
VNVGSTVVCISQCAAWIVIVLPSLSVVVLSGIHTCFVVVGRRRWVIEPDEKRS